MTYAATAAKMGAKVTTLYEPKLKPTAVATEALALLTAQFGARFKTYRRTPMLQVQPSDLPILGVYILRERRTPNAHSNHAEPRFHSTFTLGFSGAIHAETADQDHLYALEEWMDEVDETLLRNPKFVNLTEGVEAMDRQSQYAKVGETTLFEIRVEMTFITSVWFPPIVTDDFTKMHAESRYPPPDADPAEVQQIVAEYDIPQ